MCCMLRLVATAIYATCNTLEPFDRLQCIPLGTRSPRSAVNNTHGCMPIRHVVAAGRCVAVGKLPNKHCNN